MTVSDSQLAAEAVASGGADLGFVGALPADPRLLATAVGEDEMGLYVADAHPFATLRATTLSELCQEPWIVREAGSASRTCVERALVAHQVDPTKLQRTLEMNSNDAIRAAVRRGVGIAFLSKRGNIDPEGLTCVQVDAFHPQRELYLIHHADRTLPEHVGRFVAFVIAWRSRRAT